MTPAEIIAVLIFFILGLIFGNIARNAVRGRAVPAPAPAPARRAPAAKRATKAPARRSTAKRAAPKAKAKPAATKNDLKQISGVGPALEKKLNDLGVKTFEQIANWKRADVAAFDEKLNFKGRIDREKWIAQAKKLAKS